MPRRPRRPPPAEQRSPARAEAGPRVVIAGDIAGRAGYHTGDEAMFTANVDWLSRRFPSAEIVAVSADPRFTAATHGIAAVREPVSLVDWVSPLRFSAASALYRLAGACGPRAWSAGPDGGGAFFELLRGADLFFMSGAGHLTSLYPTQVRLRSFLAKTALARGVPVIVTGQTLGPDLAPGDRELLSSWLPRALHVGVRDPSESAALAERLGVPRAVISIAPDDAFLLRRRPASPAIQRLLSAKDGRPLLGLCLHHHRAGTRLAVESFVQILAATLDRLCLHTGARLVFIPHSMSTSPARDDPTLARALRERMACSDRATVLDGHLLDRDVQHLTSRCDFVVATRYHAVVFALSAGVPCAGVVQDRYTRVKLDGAFSVLGLDPATVELGGERLAGELAALWDARGEARIEIALRAAAGRRSLGVERDKLARLVARILGVEASRSPAPPEITAGQEEPLTS